MAKKKTIAGAPPDADGEAEQTESKDKFGFPPTLWTEFVGPAGSSDENVRLEALDRLLQKYQTPLKAFLRTALWNYGAREDWINECFQSFVLEKVMIKKLIRKADRERGRFRDLLKQSLYNFAIGKYRPERKRCEREGEPADSDFRPGGVAAGPSGPDLLLAGDIEWARGVLEAALQGMESDCLNRKQEIVWAVFVRRRLGTLVDGSEVESLTDTMNFVRQTSGVTLSKQDISNLQTTGDRKFARHVRDVLSEYCRDKEEIEMELGRFIELLREAMRRGGNDKRQKP